MGVLLQIGHVVMCDRDDEIGLQNARSYIEHFGLTQENAKMGRKDGCIMVVLKQATFLHREDGKKWIPETCLEA